MYVIIAGTGFNAAAEDVAEAMDPGSIIGSIGTSDGRAAAATSNEASDEIDTTIAANNTDMRHNGAKDNQ
jgi:hypothetical protein